MWCSWLFCSRVYDLQMCLFFFDTIIFNLLSYLQKVLKYKKEIVGTFLLLEENEDCEKQYFSFLISLYVLEFPILHINFMVSSLHVNFMTLEDYHLFIKN